MFKFLFSTKMVAVAMAVGLTASTVSIYAAGITGSAKKLGGTGDNTVAAPAPAASVGWTSFNSSNFAQSSTVTWTPATSSDYTINIVVKSTTATLASGSVLVSSSGTSQRTDNINLSAPVNPQSVDQANVVVSES